MESILDSVKQILGQAPEDTGFDVDILMHINSTFMILNQLGIGPDNGFAIEDNTAVWADFLGDDLMLNGAKSYTYLRVRMLFDPPPTSFAITAMEKQIDEIGHRLNVYREGKLHPLVEVVV